MHKSAQEFSLKNLFYPLTTLKALHFIFLTGIIIYFNSLFNGFVGDDAGQIINNTAAHSISNILLFFRGSTFSLEGSNIGLYYRPLTTLIYSIIYSLFGPNP